MADPKLTVKVDGVDREFFASYGLINELLKVLGSPDRLQAIVGDPELRHSVLSCILAERKPSGKVIKQVDADDCEISIDDILTLISWATEHVIDFFLKSATGLTVTAQKFEDQIKVLMSLPSGSES